MLVIQKYSLFLLFSLVRLPGDGYPGLLSLPNNVLNLVHQCVHVDQEQDAIVLEGEGREERGGRTGEGGEGREERGREERWREEREGRRGEGAEGR